MIRVCKCGKTDEEAPFYNLKTRTACVKCEKTRMKAYRARDRLLALQAYGGEHPKCSCPGCEENHLQFLSIDHIDGNGANQRRALRQAQKQTKETLKHTRDSDNNPGGSVFFRWLRLNNYPEGYRVMCYNCNTARANGPCPVHEISALETKEPQAPQPNPALPCLAEPLRA
jgi:hypothetical protein